jgi:lipopolysaccharide transport system ATP-binding protein
MSTVIRVENLSKKYVIRHELQDRYATLRDVLTRRVKNIGYRVLSSFTHHHAAPSDKTSEDFWALKDVSFEISQGDRVGIIGRNGAGKSTLLKILSRITEPTSGRARIKGRVASLLEVGTGFHPELTGRENIFLNGAILGMRKAEIKIKFDEIVAFAEIDKFLDTPVKRYSSGMYVRLAFSVAAHLDPEILLVDEVLAVGDAQFQKKCMGKMEEVSRKGRTILFVSHNMVAVRSLCEKIIYLKEGKIYKQGVSGETIDDYLNADKLQTGMTIDTSCRERTAGKEKAITKAWLENEKGDVVTSVSMGKSFKVCYQFRCSQDIVMPGFGFGFETTDGQRIFSLNNYVLRIKEIRKAKAGIAECHISGNCLLPGVYYISLSLVQNQNEWIDYIEQALSFTVLPDDVYGTGKMWEKSQGLIYTHGNISVRADDANNKRD